MEKKQDAQLVPLAELHAEPEVAFKNDQFNQNLYARPNPKWLREHPTIKKEVPADGGGTMKVPILYLPVDKVEYLLTRIFQRWKVEVISYAALFNSVSVHVRVHVFHPVNNEWTFQDGLGAVGVQTDKGEAASNLSAIKQEAVMKALPAALSYAVKDAAEKFGPVFGSNLNRRDTIDSFNGSYQKGSPEALAAEKMALQDLYDDVREYLASDEIEAAERILGTSESKSYRKLRITLELGQLRALYEMKKEEPMTADERADVESTILNRAHHNFNRIHSFLKAL